MTLDKSKIIIGVFIFVILGILLLNFFDININDNNEYTVLQRKAIYEGLGNKYVKM